MKFSVDFQITESGKRWLALWNNAVNKKITLRGKDIPRGEPCGVEISTQAEYDPQGLTPRGEPKGAKQEQQAEGSKAQSAKRTQY